jgi:hypothetical protein
MLLGNRRAGFAADMWAVGCVLGAVLKYRHPIFYSEGVNNATAQIGAIMKVGVKLPLASLFRSTSNCRIKR